MTDHLATARHLCGLCGRRIPYADDFCTTCRRPVPVVDDDQLNLLDLVDQGLDESEVAPGNVGWQQQARCRTVGPDLFFARNLPQQRLAALVCAVCPVRTDCLAFAIGWRSRAEDHSVDRPYGVWGGWLFPDTLGTSKRAAPHPVPLGPAPRQRRRCA